MSESSSSSAQGSGAPNKKINALNKAISNVDLDGHDLPPSPAPSTPRSGRQYAIATELVFTEGTDQYNASSVPIYQVRGKGGGESKTIFARSNVLCYRHHTEAVCPQVN
jgi:cysteine-S-conjugate beta-lyase